MSSVRKKDRSPHRFTVLDMILDMYDHTATVLANPKLFDRTYASLIDDIDHRARNVYHLCRVANEELDNRIQDEAAQRIKLQEMAIEDCKWLRTDIKLAKRKFHLRASKVTFWDGLVKKAMEGIKSWHEGEKRNYKDNYGL